MEDRYTPVNHAFYEALEELAALRRTCEVTFMQNGGKATARGIITALYEEADAAFIRLNNGLNIRLDRLVEINGRLPGAYC